MNLFEDNSMKYQLDGRSLLSLMTEGQALAERSFFWHFPIYLQGYDIKDNENRDSQLTAFTLQVAKFIPEFLNFLTD